MVARMPGGSASSAFTPYRRQTFLIARSRSPTAFSTARRRCRNSSDSPSIRPVCGELLICVENQ